MFPTHVVLRDSKQNTEMNQPTIELSLSTWLQILRAIDGSLTIEPNAELRIDRHQDGSATFTSLSTAISLDFTRGEMEAFDFGVRAGEFTPVLVPA